MDRIHAEFVSVVSHELRTPLAALRGSLGLLSSGRMGPVPERGQRLLEIAVGPAVLLVEADADLAGAALFTKSRITPDALECEVVARLGRVPEAAA